MRLLSYLARKKGLLFFVAVLLASGGYFVYFAKDNQNTPIYEKKQVALEKKTDQPQEKDSDGDGLKDWEEVLWQTDPNNPDTDGDGAKDGEEIKENRNPLVAGLGDETLIRDKKIDRTDNKKKATNLTDAIGQTFAGKLSQSKQLNGKIAPNEINELTGSIFGALQNLSKETDKYTLEDLRIFNANNEEIRVYANKLAETAKKEFDPIPEDEIGIFNIALSQEEPTRLEELKTISAAYRNVSEQALEIDVPKQLEESHLAIVNKFDLISKNLTTMQLVFSDPAAGYLGLQNYAKNIKTAYEALNHINRYLTDNKITFDNDEPANLFALYTELKTTQ